MAERLDQTLRELLADPGLATAQLDLAQAAALARQQLAFRQRAGAALARLRRAQADGASAGEVAELEAEVARRTARLQAAQLQLRAADIKRPTPAQGVAQIIALADTTAEKLPLTLAAISSRGQVVARAQGRDNGSFHLSHDGDLEHVALQVSDAQSRLLFRADERISVAAGEVFYLDVPLSPPQPEPGPVPSHAIMPALTGQSEAMALAILQRIGRTDADVIDQIADGQPGIVIAQKPKAGTELADQTPIALTVRRAKEHTEPERVLPKLVGETREVAERVLKRLDIAFEIERKPSEPPPGRVLAQAPDAGTPLERVRHVVLTVSEAPAADSVDSVRVPGLVGKGRQVAVRMLKIASLKAVIIETHDARAAAGVTKQEPRAGCVVPRESTVHVTVNVPKAKARS